MSNAWLIGCIGIGTACWGFSDRVNAATIQTLDAGSAVTVIDRSATFDVLNYTHNGTPLSDYREASLRISTEGDSWSGGGPAVQPYFNPFHPMPSDPATRPF